MITPNFVKIIDTPWANLQQDYYTCYMDSNSAIVNAVGVALGNASIIYSFVIVLFLYSAMGISVMIWPRWRYKSEAEKLAKHRRKNSSYTRKNTINPMTIQLTDLNVSNLAASSSIDDEYGSDYDSDYDSDEPTVTNTPASEIEKSNHITSTTSSPEKKEDFKNKTKKPSFTSRDSKEYDVDSDDECDL